MTKAQRREPAHRSIARHLGTAIVTGHRPPGDLLPGEVELAQQLQVSRSVIREALRILSAKGLIESKPKAGTRVRGRASWNLLDPDLLAWMFEGAPPLEFVRSLFQLRMIVEPAAAELAAANRSQPQLARMEAALETMAKLGLSTAEGQAADQDFHAILLEATENELLVTLSGSIAAAVRWTTYFKYRTKRHPRDPIPQHRALLSAIAAGDSEVAGESTRVLIRQARLDTEASLGAS